MIDLTERQAEVLEFIREFIRTQGMAPTLREIRAHIKISSTNGVNDHLRALEKKGYIVRQDMKSRSIRIVNQETGNADSVPPEIARRPSDSVPCTTGTPAEFLESMLLRLGVAPEHVDLEKVRSDVPIFDALIQAVQKGMSGPALDAIADVALDAIRAYQGHRVAECKTKATVIIID